MIQRKGSATWTGGIKDGKGTVSTQSGVLQEAQCPEVPLLERLKFLAIFSANLDEFFKVRVATLRRLVAEGRSVVAVTHDRDFIDVLDARVVALR